MFSTLISATFLSLLAAGVSADLTVPTPTIDQCGKVHITWSDSANRAPYDVAVVPAATPCDDVLVEFGEHNTSSLTWGAATLKAGTQVMLSILSADDDEGWSGTITVGASNDTSCLITTPSSSSSSTSSSSSSSSASSTTSSKSAGTTLVVSGNTAGAASNPEETPDVSGGQATQTGAVAAGAANAGLLPGGALSIRPTASLYGGFVATVLLMAVAF